MKLKTNPSPPNRPGHVTKGNVLDDLGFSADEALDLKIKADIWRALLDHIESQGFGTEHLVRVLKVHQPDVSNLLNGKIGRFSVGRLIQFAARLNLNAEVRITALKSAPKSMSAPLAQRTSKRHAEKTQTTTAR
jgi:predicted XRE-type DNA-binding protein